MTTSVTIKTAEKAAMVHSSSSSSNEDGSYRSHTSVTQTVAPNSQLTVSIYGNGNVSVNEGYDEDLDF